MSLISAFVASEIWARICLEIIAEKCGAILIDDLALCLIGEIDRRKAAADAFDQDRDADESDRRPIRFPDCANEIGG